MSFKEIIKKSINGVLSDQWLDCIVADSFNDKDAVVPGIFRNSDNNSINKHSSTIVNGSIIAVPDNTIAVIFVNDTIEEIISIPGIYQYSSGTSESGQNSILVNGHITDLAKQVARRFSFKGYSDSERRVVYVNLREIRDLGFGTSTPLLFYDSRYKADFEIVARGDFSIKIKDPIVFLCSYISSNASVFSFKERQSRMVLTSAIDKYLTHEIAKLSGAVTIAELPLHAHDIERTVLQNIRANEDWENRYGIVLVNLQIEALEPTDESRLLLKKLSFERTKATVYSDIPDDENERRRMQNDTKELEKIKAVFNNGIHGNAMYVSDAAKSEKEVLSILFDKKQTVDDKLETLKKAKELLDAGGITDEEYEELKKAILF